MKEKGGSTEGQMGTMIQDVSISLPKEDMTLLRQIARRMGWSVKKANRKSPFQLSMEEADRGEYTEYSSVDDFAAKVLDRNDI